MSHTSRTLVATTSASRTETFALNVDGQQLTAWILSTFCSSATSLRIPPLAWSSNTNPSTIQKKKRSLLECLHSIRHVLLRQCGFGQSPCDQQEHRRWTASGVWRGGFSPLRKTPREEESTERSSEKRRTKIICYLAQRLKGASYEWENPA